MYSVFLLLTQGYRSTKCYEFQAIKDIEDIKIEFANVVGFLPNQKLEIN